MHILGRPGTKPYWKNPTALILIAIPLGALTGALAPSWARELGVFATLFIRLIQMVVVPLVISILITGIQDSSRQGGMLGTIGKVVLSYLLFSGIALSLGLAAAIWLEPGKGILLNGTSTITSTTLTTPTGAAFWLQLVPANVFEAMAKGDLLPLVIFSSLFSIGCLRAGKSGEAVVSFLREVSAVLFQVVHCIMWLAPLATFCGLAAGVALSGKLLFSGYPKMVLAVVIGLGVQAFVVNLGALLMAGISPRKLWRAVRGAVLLAFSTASGAVAIPEGLRALDTFGVPKPVSTLIFGTQGFNLAGSTLYIGAATVFILQAAGVSAHDTHWLHVFIVLFVLSKAISAVPRGALVVVAAALPQFGLSTETIGSGIGVLFGIDALLDMTRTGVNVFGHCTIAAIVGGSERKPA